MAKQSVPRNQYGVIFNMADDYKYGAESRDRWEAGLKEVGANYYKYQLEKGDRNERRHFQTFVQLSRRKRWEAVLKVLVEHMECKAEAIQIKPVTEGIAAYCGKEEGRLDGPWEWGELRTSGRKRKSRDEELKEMWEESAAKKLKTYEEVKWKEWQQEVIDIVKGPIDDRKVYWFWDRDGGVGKSFLFNYLACLPNVIIGGGATKQVAELWYNTGPGVKCVIMDIARDQREINYVQMEKLKGGVFATGMYGAKKVVQDAVHFIVFANRPPCEASLSQDRWVIKEIN